jgi:glycosyltransferase involved in cell wall biosynthesis
MRLFIDYKTTNEPWGGINTFFRNFIECSEDYSPTITLVDDYRMADVILFGANSRGVKAKISVNDIINYGNSKALVIHRLDGLRRGFDSFVKATEAYVDGYILQSKKGKEDYNFLKKPSTIIHNGVNHDKFKWKDLFWCFNRGLNYLFISWSNSLDKGFVEYAKMSEACRDDNFTFVGRWPESVDKGRVNIIQPKSNDLLPAIYRKHDVFVFPSRLESCSNVVLEALSSVLPVIYYKNSGVAEIVGEDFGIPVDSFDDGNTIRNLLEEKYDALTGAIIGQRHRFSMQTTIEEYLKFFYEVKLR